MRIPTSTVILRRGCEARRTIIPHQPIAGGKETQLSKVKSEVIGPSVGMEATNNPQSDGAAGAGEAEMESRVKDEKREGRNVCREGRDGWR